MKILVFGEFCVDEFIYGNCTRLNPEAPTPVFKPNETKTNPGMAGNVVVNLKSLGVDTTFIHQAETIKKTRYVDDKSNYILLRVDKEEAITPLKFTDIAHIEFNDYDAVIISDYDKGYLTDEMIEYITVNAGLTFIDTKKAFGLWISNASYIKINESESLNPAHKPNILDKIKHKLIVTKGSEGCTLNGRTYSTHKAEVRDVVGAGDTFISALTAAFVKTYRIDDSIYFANKCATHVIQKRGVNDIYEMKGEFTKLGTFTEK
jgi:D-beta-D-heptose 7-phosphate kinase/D-beta-D-heptose 1-phosphate adenosyltransferase